MWIDSFKTLRFYTKRYAKNQHFDKIRRNQRSAIRGCNTEKKVLVCMHSLDWGGAERFAYETLLFLKKHKIPYLVFIEKKTEIAGHFLSILDAAKAIVYGQRYQKSESQLLELINSTEPNFIFIHHSLSMYRALPYMPRDIFIIDSLHIVEYQTGGYPYLSAKKSRYINVHHVVSKGLTNYIIENLGVPRHKVQLGYLINKSIIKKKKHQKNDNKIVVGFLGRLEKQKRPELFVELAKKFSKDNSVSFLVQGNGSLLKKTQILAQRHKLGNISFGGASEDIGLFHQKIDILVNCAENEGLTLVGLECLQYGTIFISSNVGQQNEITSKHCLVSAKPKEFIEQTSELIQKISKNEDFKNMILSEQNEIFDNMKHICFADTILKKYMLQ